MRHVSRKFQDVSEAPFLWKEFVCLDCEPRHVGSMLNVLKTCGDHVRKIFFPAYVTPTKILEMAYHCRKVTHLSIPGDTRLSLNDLEKVVCMMTNLEQLEVLLSQSLMQQDDIHSDTLSKFIEGLLKVTAAGVKELRLPFWFSGRAIKSIKEQADQGVSLPSIINVLAKHSEEIASELFLFWSKSSSKLPSFEISLYDNKQIPMNLYPSVPLSKFCFGSTVAPPPLIRLNDRGIVGLSSVRDDIFYLSEYDDCGTIRHTITPIGFICDWYGNTKNTARANFFDRNSHELLIEEKHFNCINHLDSVSYIDISYSNVHFNHLEKLAIACPNLQRLNLTGNENCLNDLQGLHAIVQKCQNLEGLNLAKISVSRIECYLILWELLSSLKKLSHLAIDLCMIKSHDPDEFKLITMFRKCHNLKALELHSVKWCKECSNTVDFLFSHFPSLRHCRMFDFQCSGFKYALTNCKKLKYLYEECARKESKDLHSFSSNCYLKQLYINSVNATYFNVTDELADALSTHGGLEYVVLHINSITVRAITTLINNSPNLILLHISTKLPLFNETHQKRCTYKDKIRKMFSYHKLFVVGSFKMYFIRDDTPLKQSLQVARWKDSDLFDTDLHSLWANCHVHCS